MERGILLRYPAPGWASGTFASLYPGAHAAVFGGHRVPLEAEDTGFEVRDSITVVGPQRHQVWLLRKPIEAANVVSQVLATGTGGINIDGCRIGTGEARTINNYTSVGVQGCVNRPGESTHASENYASRSTTTGRWPSNLVLVHASGCRQEGTRKVKGGNDPRRHDGSIRKFVGGAAYYARVEGGHASAQAGYGGGDGLETIAAWTCEPGCPVAALDRQSTEGGMHSAGNQRPMRHQTANTVYAGEWAPISNNPDYYGDQGGASRFFSQFADEAELDVWLLRLILGGP